nr:hypothetical protein TDPV-149 [Oriental turtle dovepox virus]
MFDITNLIELYESNDYVSCDYKHSQLQKAFSKLPITEVVMLVKSGFFPSKLSKKFYKPIATFCVDKIYLFKPEYVSLKDLFTVIYTFDDLSKYKEIIRYYYYEVSVSNSYQVYKKCKNILGYTDDYDNEIIQELSEDDLVEKMVNFPGFRKLVYKKKILSIRILKEMYYKHKVLPINKGITPIREEDICFFTDVLYDAHDDDDVLYLLLEINEQILDSDEVKETIIKKICKGENIEVFRYYVSHYLIDQAKLGLYYNIFFSERDIISDYGLTDESLKIICKYIDRYSRSIPSIIKLLLDNSNYTLLASVVDYIPEERLSENLYMNIVRHSNETKPKIKIFKPEFLSECLMVMCYLRGYDDIVDFLIALDVEAIIRNRINPFNDYTFTTDWFNKNTELVRLYISFYFLDPVMMRKLLFEYPLCETSTTVAIEELKKHRSSINNNYNIDYREEFKIVDLPRSFNIPISEVVPTKEYNSNISFISDKSYKFKITSQLLKYNILQSIKVENLCYSYNNNLHFFYFNTIKPNCIVDSTSRLIYQIGDLGRLARHGFLSFTDNYFGKWIPLLNYSKILDHYQYNGPTCVRSWQIGKLDLKAFVKYKDLPEFFLTKYNIDFLLEKEVLLYYCIYSYLLLYILVGSVTYVEQENIYYFITNIINSFIQGLGIRNSIDLLSEEVIKEIIIIKKLPESKRKLSSIRPVSLLNLCKRVCAFISRDGKK